MKKRILISTRNRFKLYGDYYESDDSSPKLHTTSNRTEQDLMELIKVNNKYRVNENQLDYWEVEVSP